MKHICLLCALFLSYIGMSATSDSDLRVLNYALEERELYQQQKQQRIQFLQQAPMSHYERRLALTEEYQS